MNSWESMEAAAVYPWIQLGWGISQTGPWSAVPGQREGSTASLCAALFPPTPGNVWQSACSGILPSRQPGQWTSTDVCCSMWSAPEAGNAPCTNRETALFVWEFVFWNLLRPHLLLQLSAGTVYKSRLLLETASFQLVKMANQESLSCELDFGKSWDVKEGKHLKIIGQ